MPKTWLDKVAADNIKRVPIYIEFPFWLSSDGEWGRGQNSSAENQTGDSQNLFLKNKNSKPICLGPQSNVQYVWNNQLDIVKMI